MAISLFSTKLKQSFGKFWRAYIVDECPDEKSERLYGHRINFKSPVDRAVSIQVPLPSYHHAGFFRVSIAS
jgi:hypothetical protein